MSQKVESLIAVKLSGDGKPKGSTLVEIADSL